MKYKIVVDSPCDYTKEMETWDNIVSVPLTLEVGDFKALDDETLDKDDFIKRMQAYEGAAKSACPSIESWLKAFEGDETDIYVITITAKLSGTYNSAVQAANIFNEDAAVKKNIYVFDSIATSTNETLIARKIKEVADSGASFEEVIKIVENYKDNMEFYFFIDDLENMRKNGRLSTIQASLLNALRIKLICKSDNGVVGKVAQEISVPRALAKLADIVVKLMNGIDPKDCKLIISHCRCEDRAKLVIDRITSKVSFGEVTILEMGGLNSLYTNVGGLVLSFTKIK